MKRKASDEQPQIRECSEAARDKVIRMRKPSSEALSAPDELGPGEDQRITEETDKLLRNRYGIVRSDHPIDSEFRNIAVKDIADRLKSMAG